MQLVMFSKHLGALSIPEAGQAIKGLGFDGVDLTVRPGGHVEPIGPKADSKRGRRDVQDGF